MEVKIGDEITGFTVLEEEIVGTIACILEKTIVVENATGRHLIRQIELEKQGYVIYKPKEECELANSFRIK